jgi:transporter family protein
MFGFPWYIYAFIAAVLVAVITLFEKKELKTEHSLEYVVVLSIFNVVVAAFLWPWVNFDIAPITLLWMYGASILGALSLWFTAKALRHLDVSVVSPQLTLNVVFALLFAFLFLGETVNLVQAVGIVILLGGSLLLTREALHNTTFGNHVVFGHTIKEPNKAVHLYQILIVAAMAFLGASTVIDKFVLGSVSVFDFIFYIHIFLAFNHLVIYGIVHRGFKNLFIDINRAGWIMVIVAVITIFSRLAAAEALALASVALVIPLKRMSSVIATIVGGKMFNEKGLLFRSIVSILMIVGVWLVVK